MTRELRIMNRYIKGVRMEQLKKCPFCGADVDMMSGVLVKRSYHIVCQNSNCGADVWFYGAESNPEKTALKWNRRTDGKD